MVIMLGTADGEARSFFKESDIGDVDGDGAPEILDGWGQPIQFLRWAPGFAAESELMSGDPAEDHDPYDVFRQDPRAFRLSPLIWSAGADGISDIRATNNYSQLIDPYEPTQYGLLGEARDSETDGDGEENWQDNIHNHIRDVK